MIAHTRQYMRYKLLGILCLLATIAWAQSPGRSGSESSQDTRDDSRNSGQREVAPDTFDIFIFQVNNPNEETLFSDSLLTNFQQYDVTRTQADDYANLGVPGSAHYPLVFQERVKMGMDLGWHAYDLYYIDGHSLPYYRLERPHANLSFTQGGAQLDNIVKTQFSRNFAKGVNYVLDYQAITQKGASVQYPNQRNQTRALSTGLWFHNANGRYDGFISYSANTTNAEDNGGLTVLPETDGEFSSPSTAEVFLVDAQTRHALRELMYTHYYRFGGQVDSLGNASRAFTLSHQIEYDKNTYRFDDAYTTADDTFFFHFPQLEIDPRGARYFVEHKSLSNSFRLSTFRQANNAKQASKQQRDLVEVGLTHQYHKVSLEPADRIVQNLLLTGKLGFRPNEKLRLQADAALALLDQAGDYHLRAFMDMNLGKAGAVRFKLTNQLFSPTYLQNNFRLTQEVLWSNDFSKTLETTLGAKYSFPKNGFSVEGQYHLLNNFIYFDTLALPQQSSSPVSILQLSVQKDFDFRAFHLDNRIVFQTTDNKVLEQPSMVGKHSLYYQGLWFKALQVQIGADVRYTSAFQPNYYNPFIGQFVLQNRQKIDFYPNLDANFSIKVSRFRAFFKWENITETFDLSQRYYYTSAFSPWPESSFRFGVSWRMLD